MKSGIENPSKSVVIGRCGGDEKPNDHAEPTSRTLKNKTKKKHIKTYLSTLQNCDENFSG